jgi:hypothetical protein
MNINGVEIEIIFDQNIRKYIKIYLNLTLKPLCF